MRERGLSDRLWNNYILHKVIRSKLQDEERNNCCYLDFVTLELQGEFAKNRFGKQFPVAVKR